MTTVPDWELHRRDLRPIAQQLSSLRHFLAVYASLPPVTRRKARLATDLPATALAGLDFHQLDSFERFHPLTGITLPQALLGAMKRLSSDVLQSPRCATVNGFSVHANVSIPEHDRMRSERLCRYAARTASRRNGASIGIT